MSTSLASVLFEYSSWSPRPQTLTLTAVDVKEGGNKDSVPIPRLPEDGDLCPVTCTYNYLEDTKDIHPSTSLYLFISATPPHQDLSNDRLRNWLKSVMASAGISIATPHSIRALTTSTAFANGVPIEEILDCANWSTRSTFERFYQLSM
jgi:hypothetical protein